MIEEQQQAEQRKLTGISNYAKSDSSDPFTFARCMTHHKMGLDKPLQDGSDGHYQAQPYPEVRKTATGDEYVVTVYKNIERV